MRFLACLLSSLVILSCQKKKSTEEPIVKPKQKNENPPSTAINCDKNPNDPKCKKISTTTTTSSSNSSAAAPVKPAALTQSEMDQIQSALDILNTNLDSEDIAVLSYYLNLGSSAYIASLNIVPATVGDLDVSLLEERLGKKLERKVSSPINSVEDLYSYIKTKEPFGEERILPAIRNYCEYLMGTPSRAYYARNYMKWFGAQAMDIILNP